MDKVSKIKGCWDLFPAKINLRTTRHNSRNNVQEHGTWCGVLCSLAVVVILSIYGINELLMMVNNENINYSSYHIPNSENQSINLNDFKFMPYLQLDMLDGSDYKISTKNLDKLITL